jgi:hypothetical protein
MTDQPPHFEGHGESDVAGNVAPEDLLPDLWLEAALTLDGIGPFHAKEKSTSFALPWQTFESQSPWPVVGHPPR